MARQPNVRVEARRLPPNANRSDREKAAQQLLRIFKRACNEFGVLNDLKEHEFFIRTTDINRRKRQMRLRGALEAEKAKEKNKISKDQRKNRG